MAASRHEHEVIVIDNGSVDGSAGCGRAQGAIVMNGEGRVACLRNGAAKWARGTILAFIDADHEIAPEWVAAALEHFGDEAVGAVGAPYHPPDDANWVQRT